MACVGGMCDAMSRCCREGGWPAKPFSMSEARHLIAAVKVGVNGVERGSVEQVGL